MRLKFIKYAFTALMIAISFWFYFHIDTYPYKVARWIQPYEAFVINAVTEKCSPEFSWINLFADYAVASRGAYSVQVAFLSPDKRLETCSRGYKDKLFGERISYEHRYRYASTTKLITGATILRLKDEGKISLNDKLINFFPELTDFKDYRVSQISITHLLNHSAGFNRLTLNGDPMFLRRNKPWCPNNFSKLEAMTLGFNPGEKQVYSNEAYCLLGEIIHRVTGEEYRAYVEREFSLAERGIKFVTEHYYDDEVRYDYRYEEWYNDSYLTLFDFNALSSSAGLSGSAAALAGLLWDIHHHTSSPFIRRHSTKVCNFHKRISCANDGVFQYEPEKNGMVLYYHEGYLPGSSSIAVIDSYGGVTVVLRSGADKLPEAPSNEWIVWLYQRLNLHYTMQGELTILTALSATNIY